MKICEAVLVFFRNRSCHMERVTETCSLNHWVMGLIRYVFICVTVNGN
jgi:hypothetical protein